MADTITTWTPISSPTDFRDDAVFDIDSKTKSIQVLVEQPIVAGENKSQLIKFQMGRYYDAIDLTAMQVNIVFISPAGNRGISAAVNTEYSDDAIRFGWLVPYEACPEKGKLYFAVEFVGADYTLKTTAGCTNVLDSISDRDIVPEPVEQDWYIVLQTNVAILMQEAQRALGKVEGIFNALGTPMTADTAAEMVDETAIYVYTGSETGYTYGNWYYYDGTEWVSGGTYVSTALYTDSAPTRGSTNAVSSGGVYDAIPAIDPTLTKSGQAADAFETGNKITSLKEDLNVAETGGYHSIQVTYEEGGYIKNYSPGDVAPYSGQKYTDYIDVSTTKNGKIIVKEYNGAGVEELNGRTYNAWYDVNKNWIGVLTVTNDVIEVPKGAVYVRLSCRSAYTHVLSLFTNGVFDMVKNDTSDTNYIDILQWNVGIFKDGTHKPSTEESPTQIVSMKKTVGDLNPHIVNTQEYIDTVDDANTISSANIFSFKYSNKTHRYGNKCFSKFRIINSETITFDSGSNRNCRAYDVEINNKVITIINVHLSIELNPSTHRTADIQQLINYMNAKKYVILTGDFNVSSDAEYDAFKSAGYVLCNGGDFGWFDTWPVMENMWDGFTPDWPCYHIDNIIVSSNITPQNVTKISCSVSDHAPLMATLRID